MVPGRLPCGGKGTGCDGRGRSLYPDIGNAAAGNPPPTELLLTARHLLAVHARDVRPVSFAQEVSGANKKIINDPRNVVQESIEGLIDAYGGYIRKLGDLNALVKANLRKEKVGLLIGGGSGHEQG